MAGAFVKEHVNFSTKTTGTIFTVSLNSDVPAGNTLIVTLSYDNTSSTTPTAAAENGWLKIGQGYSTAAGGAGVHTAAYHRYSPGDPSGTSWDFDLPIGGQVAARVATITEWSGFDSGYTLLAGAPLSSVSYAIPAGKFGISALGTETDAFSSINGTLAAQSAATSGSSLTRAAGAIAYQVGNGSLQNMGGLGTDGSMVRFLLTETVIVAFNPDWAGFGIPA